MSWHEVDPSFVRDLGNALKEAESPSYAVAHNLERLPPQLGVGNADGHACDAAYALFAFAWQEEFRRCHQRLESLTRRLTTVAAPRYEQVERFNVHNLKALR